MATRLFSRRELTHDKVKTGLDDTLLSHVNGVTIRTVMLGMGDLVYADIHIVRQRVFEQILEHAWR